MSNEEIIYLFKNGRRQRSELGSPTEFFYGFSQLENKGLNVRFVEESELGLGGNKLFDRIAGFVSKIFGGISVGAIWHLLLPSSRQKIKSAKVIITTTNNLGLVLACLKTLRLIRSDIIMLAMGLLPHVVSKRKTRLYEFVLKNVNLVCISKSEKYFLNQVFSSINVKYIPFGVDSKFWSIAPTNIGHDDYVFAIGNDLNRDWDMLIAAWDDTMPKLKLYTSLPVKTHTSNVEVVKSDCRTSILTDDEILKLYQEAMFVIVPVKDVIQPSGQSCCLQAMSCGKAVVLTDTIGLWDRENLVHNKNIILVEPNNSKAISDAVKDLERDYNRRLDIGINARKLIESELNVDNMANAIKDLMENI